MTFDNFKHKGSEYLDIVKINNIIKETSKTNAPVNLIYLDFDGVITTVNTRYKIDESRVKILLDFIKETPNTYIIVSSTWRYNDFKTTIEEFKADKYNRINSQLFAEMIEYIIGVTPRTDKIRGEEINLVNSYFKYVIKFNNFNYIILDDDSDMIITQQKYFILTHPYYGICESDILEMKRIFKLCNDRRKLLTNGKVECTNLIFRKEITTLTPFSESFDSDGNLFLNIGILTKSGEFKDHNELTKIFIMLSEEIRKNKDTTYHFNFDKFIGSIEGYNKMEIYESFKYQSVLNYLYKIKLINLIIT